MSSKPINTKTRILDVTWNLLENGDKTVRMSDIAKAAGISRQALYLHFPNRTELLVATTRHIDVVKNVDARLARSRSATSGVERLHAFIEGWAATSPKFTACQLPCAPCVIPTQKQQPRGMTGCRPSGTDVKLQYTPSQRMVV